MTATGDRDAFVARLHECKDIFGSVNKLAKAAKIPTATVQGFFKDRDPKRAYLIAIAAAAGVNLAWLAMGSGPKFPGSEEDGPGDHLSSEGDSIVPEGFTLVPVFGVRASAGHGASVFESDEIPEAHMAFRTSWLRRVASGRLELLSCIHADGRSNEPAIMDKDLLLVDRNVITLTTEGFYAASLEGQLVVKYVVRPNPGHVELRSINQGPEYQTKSIDLEEWGDRFRIVGKIIWVARRI